MVALGGSRLIQAILEANGDTRGGLRHGLQGVAMVTDGAVRPLHWSAMLEKNKGLFAIGRWSETSKSPTVLRYSLSKLKICCNNLFFYYENVKVRPALQLVTHETVAL